MDELMARRHIVITGTGRAGTTFLVILLTRLGLETGFSPENLKLFSHARAGLESDPRDEGAPYVVKSPWFCDYASDVLRRKDIHIDHVFVPMRDLKGAAESRRYVMSETLAHESSRASIGVAQSSIPGGLWHTDSGEEQEQVLLMQVYKVFLALSGSTIPVTLLRYPKLVRDSKYVYEKLQPILGTVSYDTFDEAFRKSVRPEWVHRFGKDDD